MCKEDIRLARAAQPRGQWSGSVTATAQRVLTANAERYSLVCGTSMATLVAGDPNVMVYALNGGRIFPLMSLTNDHLCDTVSLTEVGEIICEEIWVVSGSANAATPVYVGETAWNQTQESI